MNAMDTGCKPSTSAFRGASETPLLAAPVRKTTYRRSAQTKAPRKRTFIANMSKINPLDGTTVAPGQGVVSVAAAAQEVSELCFGGNDGGNGCIPRRAGYSGDDDSSSSSSTSTTPSPAVLLGAAVLMGALVLAPGTARAEEHDSPRKVAPHAPTASMCLSAPVAHGARGAFSRTPAPATLANATKADDAIVYGHIELSRGERRMLARRQQHFRETLRTEHMSL